MGERRIKEKIQEGEETYQSLMHLCPDAVVIIRVKLRSYLASL